MSKRILITPRSLTRTRHPALSRLEAAGFELVFGPTGRQPEPDELRRLLPGCVGYLCGVEQVGAETLRVADQLRVISRNGTGVDNIDLDAARQLGIVVCRAEGANARGVAELTLALILALARSVAFLDRSLKAGRWQRLEGIELEGRTLALVGCGRIGRLVARFASWLDCRVLAYDPRPDPEFRPSENFSYVSLDALWSEADVISLHCPLPADKRPVIRRENLALMKKGALLVNTARAGLIDEAAVLAALDSGQLGGFAMDVFHEEPPHDHPLVSHPNVIATPHIGGFTRESISRAAEIAVDNILATLNIPPQIETR